MYSSGSDQKAIIVFAHGYGAGGHNSYMPSINYFAQNGYYVFAYDATGNDESGGKGIGGVPQGVIDLDYAISFVEDSGNFPDLPIGLFGHSWGGYSVSNVLTYHQEVEAVIECSGPNSSSDLVEGGGTKTIGPVVKILMPVIKVYERAKYGDYATNSALIGFASTDAEIMVVHSSDDNIVPIEYGYDIYYDAFNDDPRFTFIRLEGKGHNQFLNVDQNKDLYESFVAFYDENLI
jgi:dipeptidyl aminopeptidase/acylaminoacyl peptidase